MQRESHEERVSNGGAVGLEGNFFLFFLLFPLFFFFLLSFPPFFLSMAPHKYLGVQSKGRRTSMFSISYGDLERGRKRETLIDS